MKQKAQGVLPGVSDVVLPIRARGFSGIYCELKAAGGSPNAEQKFFLTEVAKQGFFAFLANDLDTIKQALTEYLDDAKCS